MIIKQLNIQLELSGKIVPKQSIWCINDSDLIIAYYVKS